VRQAPRSIPGAVVALLLASACLSGDGPSSTAPTGSTARTGGGAKAPTGATGTEPSEPPGSLHDVEVALEHVATLEAPLALAVRSGDPTLYVAEKTGRVVALEPGDDPRVVLDLSDTVSLGSEQGLLGIAFSPDGASVYVDYTDTQGDTHVAEFEVGADGDVDPQGRELLLVDQPFSNHNGGALAFGPDGYLYVALGDGGSAGDPDGNAQALDSLLGKILRISPEPSGGLEYSIPSDNPFVGVAGTRPEIWAYGLRNPWRFSFDRQTGDLWIGDVGQGGFEEIDVAPAGRGGSNFGWDRFEGLHAFEGDADRRDVVFPVHEYPHGGSVCAVTGGYVYRGRAIPDLRGAYLFADFCPGRVEAFRLDEGFPPEVVALGPVVPALSSFGEDTQGELYVLSLAGGVFKVVPAEG
jgi:glucose/arabinose dehydrogenase